MGNVFKTDRTLYSQNYRISISCDAITTKHLFGHHLAGQQTSTRHWHLQLHQTPASNSPFETVKMLKQNDMIGGLTNAPLKLSL